MIASHLNNLIKLGELASNHFELRSADRKKYLDAVYECASAVYRDYVDLLTDLRQKGTRARKPETLINFLEQRRRSLLPERKKLTAIVSKHIERNPSSKFDAGIMGLITGSVTVFDQRYFRIYDFDAERRRVRAHTGRHTVLDLLNKLKGQKGKSIVPIRKKLLESIDHTLRCLDITWEDISQGYTNYSYSVSDKFKELTQKHQKTSETTLRMLEQFEAMAESNSFSRSAATDFETFVGGSIPCLIGMAQDIRELIHDLDNNEPNVMVEDLLSSLRAFKAEINLRFKVNS